MPTKCQPLSRCDAYKTGWLRGTHPSVAEGAVNKTVCFRYRSCCKYSVIIRVRNCGSYYVYHLINTPECNLRYCGTGWKRSELRYDYHISFKIWFPLTSQAFGSSREHFQKSQKNGGGGGGKTSLTSLFPNLCREMRKLHSLSASASMFHNHPFSLLIVYIFFAFRSPPWFIRPSGSSREHFQKSQKNGGGGGGKTSLTSLFPNLCREMRKLHSLSASASMFHNHPFSLLIVYIFFAFQSPPWFIFSV